tara:strand:- start:51 stop:3008 length:2958 start_codon:yes stop_codon:yes gene_type:complete
MSEKFIKRKSPVGGPPRRVKKPKNDEQAPTVFEKMKDSAVPTTQEILTTETKKKTKKRRIDPPRPATDIDVSDVLRNACRKLLIIVLRNAFLQWFAATVVPYETCKDLRTPYKKKQDLINNYVQKIKDDRENEVEVQKLKQQLAEYKNQHGTVNVMCSKDNRLGNKISDIRNKHKHTYIVKYPKFFDWLLDEGLIMAFRKDIFRGSPEKDEKNHQKQIDEVRVKQEKEKEAFEKKKYRVDALEDRFPKFKEELAALNKECSKDIDVSDVLRNAWRKWLIITIATTVVPYETYKDFQTPYKTKERDLINKYVQEIKDDRENEVEVQKLKDQIIEYKKQHGTVNVMCSKDNRLGNKISDIRNRHDHVVKYPKFFQWLLDEGLIMAFAVAQGTRFSSTEKDEKKHQEKIDEVRAKQEKEKEAFEKRKYRVVDLKGRFPKIKDELAALNKECLEEYHAHIEECKIASKNNRHPIYGIPAPLKRNIHGDSYVVVFDKRGKRVTLDFKKEHWIQPDGGIYQLKENGEKERLRYSENFVYRYKTQQTNVKTSLVLLFSNFPHLDWKPFCRTANAEIDHVKQVHEKCHFAYLEAVPSSENVYRKKFSAIHSTQRQKQANTRGKPFHIFHDGKLIFTASTLEKGTAFFKKTFPKEFQTVSEITLTISISEALKGKPRKRFSEQKFTFAYTQEYLDSQNDLLGEVWSYNPEKTDEHPKNALTWKQPNDPRLKGCKLLAISSKGRIMLCDGEKKYGNLGRIGHEEMVPVILDDQLLARPRKIHSYYDGKGIHILVWPAFKEKKIGDRMVLHRNGDQYLRTNEDGKTINVYTNELESLYLGDAAQNNKDKSDDDIAWARRFPENEAKLYDPSGRLLGTVYSPTEIHRKFGIKDANFPKLWRGTRLNCQQYTIELKIPRRDQPLCVRVGKIMIDKKTKKRCVIKKLKPRGGVEIEFCGDNKIIQLRRNSVTNPAFEAITGDEGPTDDEIIASMQALGH